VRILPPDLEDVVAAVALDGVEAVRAQLVEDEGQEAAIPAVGVIEELHAGLPDRVRDPAPARQPLAAHPARLEDRPGGGGDIFPHEQQRRLAHLGVGLRDVGREAAAAVHHVRHQLRRVVDRLAEELHVHVAVRVGDRPFDRADEDDVVLGQRLLHLPDGGRIPLAHVLVLRELRHVLLQPAQIGERPLRNPGCAARLVDGPVVGVNPEEANPVGDLAAHPVRNRIVDETGDIQAGVLPGQGVHLHGLSPGVGPAVIVAAELFQQRPAVGEVVGEDAIDRLPVDGAPEAFLVVHCPVPPSSA